MKKKLTSIILCLGVVISLCSCNKDEIYPLEVDGAFISDGVFAYYLNEVMSNLKDYDINENDQEKTISTAITLCEKYLALNNFLNENEINLSQSYKLAVADETESLWGMFSSFYTKIGVEKTDLTKIMTFENSKNQLIDYYYGKDAKKEVSDKTLKKEFEKTYVGFKAIEAQLNKVNELGEVVELSKSEKQELEDTFSALAKKINSNDLTIDEANTKYNETLGLVTTSELSATIIQDENPMYDKDFFEMVAEIDDNHASVLKTDSAYYLIYKINITEDEHFILHRQNVLFELETPAIDEKIDEFSKDFSANYKEKDLIKIYDKVKDARS